MKTVVIDARESGTTTGRYVDKMIENLRIMNPGHKFILLAKPHRIDFLKQIAPHFEIVETKYREFSFGEQLGFRRQIKKLKPDLVHFPMVQQPILYRGKVVTSMLDLTTLRFKNPSKNPLVFGIKQVIYGFVNKRAAKKSKAIICISEYVKNDVIDYTGVSPDKIFVTYNAADKITEAPVPLPSLEGKTFIMYVGRPQPHKNLGRLIEAFQLLKKDHPDLLLVLAGKKDPLYEAHERTVLERDIKDVIFTSFISEGELRWLYENTACYVIPSLSEGFGLPGLEAMAHGAPVASSNATCLPEIYETAAAYFNPLDIRHIAVVIDDVLSNTVYANKLRTRGEKRVTCFSWQKMAKETLDVYNKVLNES